MTISIVNAGVGGNSTGATATISGVTVPAGAIIVVLVGEASGASSLGSVSDSAGNSYSIITQAANDGSPVFGVGGIFYSTTGNALSNGTITYTKQSSPDAASLSAVYVTGAAATNPLDTAVTASATGLSTNPSVTSGTPATNCELFIGALSWSPNSGTFGEDGGNGWATPPNQGTSESFTVVAGGSQVNGSYGAKTFAPSLSASFKWAAFIIGFKAPPSGRFLAIL